MAAKAAEEAQGGSPTTMSPFKRGSTNKAMLDGLKKSHAAARAFETAMRVASENQQDDDAPTKSRFPNIFAAAEVKKKLVFRTSNR